MLRLIGWNAGLPPSGDTAGSITAPDRITQKLGMIPLRGEAPTEYSRTGTIVRQQGWERHPIVNACVREILNIAAAVPLQAFVKNPADDDDIALLGVKHPLQKLVDAPSPFLSAQRYRSLSFLHYLLYGNALTFLERAQPNAPPSSLRLIHPELLSSVYVNVKGYPIYYLWRDDLGYTHTSPCVDIVHQRDLNARGLVFGYPRAASAINDIVSDQEASQYVRQVVTNDGWTSLVFIANEDTTQDEARLAEAAWKERMSARGERGMARFVGGVKDVKALGFSLKDLEFPDLRRVAREDICAAFGVDPRMIGLSSGRDAGMSGMQYIEARRRLVQQTVEPLMRAFESELNLWLAPEFGDVYLRFDPDSLQALVEDDDATSTRVRAEVAAGLKTIEEGRVALNMASEYTPSDMLGLGVGVTITPVSVALAGPDPKPVALDAEGNPLPTIPPPMVPKPTAAEPAKVVVPEPAKDQGSQSGKGDDTAGTDLLATAGKNPNDPTNPPKITDGSVDVSKKRSTMLLATRVYTRGLVLTKAERNMLWRQFDARATAEEAPYRRTALTLFGEERHNVARVFERQIAASDGHPDDDAVKFVKAAQRALARMYAPGGEVRTRWEDRFHPVIGSTYAKGAERIVQSVNDRASLRAKKPPKKGQNTPSGAEHLPFDFHMQNPGVQQAIRARAERLAAHVGDTTGEAISDALKIGLRDGMGLRDIATLVDKTAFGSYAGQRATTIARTESIGALNQGEYDAAGESGVIAGKEWLTQNDDRVRDSHAECEDEGMIALDEPFEATDMQHPGDQDGDAADIINCRCSLLYYDTLDAGASSL